MLRAMPTVAGCVLLAGTAHAVTFPSGNGTITFSARIEPTAKLSVVTHDLGPGVVAYVGTYEHGGETTVTEVMAMRGDCVDFDAGGTTPAARRHRHDRWPDPFTTDPNPEALAWTRR